MADQNALMSPLKFFIDLILFGKLSSDINAFWDEEEHAQNSIPVYFKYDPPIRVETVPYMGDYGEIDGDEDVEYPFDGMYQIEYTKCIKKIVHQFEQSKSQATIDFLNDLSKTLTLLLKELDVYQMEYSFFVNEYNFKQCLPPLKAILLKLKDRIENYYLPLCQPTIEVSTEPLDSTAGVPKLVWKKDPHLFYLLFSALYEEGFLENAEGKKALKPLAEALYSMVNLSQKYKNQTPVTFQSFYQNLKSTGLLQEDARNTEVKSLIIKMLDEIKSV